ncbi:transcription initiation factor IIB family protein [Halomicroarcula sp. F13]|uniref:Transcription initiation factor IIB n=1 Tax=Haloarcula rubra TaxID=2487747 RepID=A0AAW4PYV1_9EURY|nr:transcription initiation factor IIB family protein [Halomicroarcula rubra]MBX0325824.1 transcription initiation factor IIB family protein [Halomicroarcula rubra]
MSSSKPYADGFDEDPENDVHGDCPECAGNIETDGGERACTDCGLVVDGHGLAYGNRPRWFDDGPDTRRTGAPLTPARHDSGLSSEIGRGSDANGRPLSKQKRRQIRRLRREHNRARFRSKAEQNLAFACGEIARIVGALDLKHDIREFASVLFRQAQSDDLLRGRSLEGFAAGSVFAACRCRGLPRSAREIAAVARCDENTVLNSYRVLNAELELATAVQTPRQLLPGLVSELDVDDVVRNRARELIEVAESEGVSNGRRPSGVAAAAIYLAGQEFGTEQTQAELADAADVSAVTIRERMYDLQEAL